MDTFLRNRSMRYRQQDSFLRIVAIIGALAVAIVTGDILGGESHTTSVIPVTVLVGLGFVALIAPIEWLLVLSAGAVILADSSLFPAEQDSIQLYYTRFLPLGILAIRSLLIFLTHRLDTRILPGIFLKPFGLFFFLATFSALYDRLNPINTLLRSLSMGFALAAFGIGVPFYMANEARLKRGLHGLLAVMALVSTAGLVPLPFISDTVTDFGDFVRVRGIFCSVNTLGLMAMLTFFPLFGWWRESAKGRRFLLGTLTMTVLVTLLISGSRASFVGLLTGALAFVGLSRINIRSKVLIFSIVVAILLVMLLPGVLPGLMREDTGLRPQLWARAFELGMRSPIYGTGFGSTDRVFRPDQKYLASIGVYSGGSHNEYLRLFVGLGGIGVFLALFGFTGILLKVMRLVRRQTNPLMLLSLFAAVVSGLTNALFEDWIFAFGGAPAIPFWFFLAVMSLCVHQHELGQGQSKKVQRNSSANPNLLAFSSSRATEDQ